MAIVVVAVNIYRDKKNVGVIFFFWRGMGGKYTLNAFLGFDGGDSLKTGICGGKKHQHFAIGIITMDM